MTTWMKKAIRASIFCLAMVCLISEVAFAGNWIIDNNGGKIWNDNPRSGETITWSGGYDDNGCATGWGVKQWYLYGQPNGRYEGEMQGGKNHGQGTYFYPNSNVYEGDWVNGSREGYGKFTKANGEYYNGKWQRDRRDNDRDIVSPIPKSVGDRVVKGFYEGGFWGHGAISASGWVEEVSDDRIKIRLDSMTNFYVGDVSYHYGAVIWDYYDSWHYDNW